MKLVQRFWRKCSKVVNIFSTFYHYLPLEKGQGPSFERILIPIPQECFVASFVEIDPVIHGPSFEKKTSLHRNALCQVW